MRKYNGKSVCGGAAVGRIKVFTRRRSDFSRKADLPTAETARLATAKRIAAAQLKDVCEKARREVGEENAEIFEIQIMLLDDDEMSEFLNEQIQNGSSAQAAVAAASELFSARFSEMDDDYMSARAADVCDVCGRLLDCLNSISDITCTDNQNGSDGSAASATVANSVSDAAEKQAAGSSYNAPSAKNANGHIGEIICAEDLSPSETIALDKSRVIAFVTAHGSENSHTAILARSMGIPAIIGVGSNFPNGIEDGAEAAVDGYSGLLTIEPDYEERSRCLHLMQNDNEKKMRLKSLVGLPNITSDGRTIDIFANIGSADEAEAALENDAGGIGLFRSEFLYLDGNNFPDEEKQFKVYSRVLKKMGNKPVVIRTLDVGADKQADYFGLEIEENPALGMRGIRVCLARRSILETQLRALYRASVHGKLGIMFPMIANVWEVEQAIAVCDDVKQQLSAENIPFSETVEIGIMIETPAAAIISDKLAPLVDFFSVGTNDLTQYTLACDRQNENAARFSNPHHEAVLRLIKIAADNAHRFEKWIGVCGELAADTEFTEKLLSLGIDELSVPSSKILELRDTVRNITQA